MDELKDLVIRAQAGDSSVYEEIYNATKSKAYYLALQLLKNPHDAEDALQDSFINAFTKLNTLDNPEKFQGFLDTIVINRAKDILKKKKPMTFSELQSDDGKEFVPEDEEERTEFLPAENMDYQETKRLIQEIIVVLPEEQRMAVILYYYKEMSVGQIAEYFECSDGTIKSRLNYARKTIKAKVEEMEKKGTKLYSIPVLPFLYWMFRSDAEEAIFDAANMFQKIQISDKTKTANEAIKASTDSIEKSLTGNGIKGIVIKVGGLSLGIKTGLAGVIFIVALVSGIMAYINWPNRYNIEQETIDVKNENDQDIEYTDNSADLDTTGIIEDSSKITGIPQNNDDSSSAEESSNENPETNIQEEPQDIISKLNSNLEEDSAASSESKDIQPTQAVTSSASPSTSSSNEKDTKSSETVIQSDDIDANYEKLLSYGFKGNLYMGNISNVQEKDGYYLCNADVYMPECISEKEYEDIQNGVVTQIIISGVEYQIEPVTETDDCWEYCDYKLVNGNTVFYIDINDEQADEDVDDYYDITFGLNYLRPDGYYYIKKITSSNLAYVLLEHQIQLKVSKDADIEMLENDEYTSSSVEEFMDSTYENRNGQIVFDESGVIIKFYEYYSE